MHLPNWTYHSHLSDQLCPFSSKPTIEAHWRPNWDYWIGHNLDLRPFFLSLGHWSFSAYLSAFIKAFYFNFLIYLYFIKELVVIEYCIYRIHSPLLLLFENIYHLLAQNRLSLCLFETWMALTSFHQDFAFLLSRSLVLIVFYSILILLI